MLTEPITIKDIEQFAVDNSLFGVSRSDLIKAVYAKRLREKVASVRRLGSSDTRMLYSALAELTEVVEFLVDHFEKGSSDNDR
jgi:fructose-1,6-bisphosphatase/inositol monophosphatase family enzyme